jgi:hypothetical protein
MAIFQFGDSGLQINNLEGWKLVPNELIDMEKGNFLCFRDDSIRNDFQYVEGRGVKIVFCGRFFD